MQWRFIRPPESRSRTSTELDQEEEEQDEQEEEEHCAGAGGAGAGGGAGGGGALSRSSRSRTSTEQEQEEEEERISSQPSAHITAHCSQMCLHRIIGYRLLTLACVLFLCLHHSRLCDVLDNHIDLHLCRVGCGAEVQI